MEGIKRRLKSSLEFRISILNTGIIIGIMLLGGAFSFMTSYLDASEIQDNQLRQIATVMNYDNVAVKQGIASHNTGLNGVDSEARFVIQPLTNSANGNPSNRSLIFPNSLMNGIQTVMLNNKAWRVFVMELDNKQRIAIAQSSDWRDEIVLNGALRTLIPLMVLIPCLVIINILFFRRMFSPVNRLAHSIDQRSEEDLSTVPSKNVPDEIQPFVNAINRLLARMSKSIEMQRRFVADAAHELRSPMTALSLQTEGLASCHLPEEAKPRLMQLREGLKRSRSLLEQLLSFARTQQQTLPDVSEVSVQATFHRVLEDLLPLAEEKDIDLGVISEADTTLRMNPTELQTVIKNLVDNAIRYTPENGQIDLGLALINKEVHITVQDSGSGIAQEEMGRVFDPFYRVLGNDAIGSGLGLSIVKTIVDRQKGRILMENIERNDVVNGLLVTLIFPIA